jgi:hypothetical protein
MGMVLRFVNDRSSEKPQLHVMAPAWTAASNWCSAFGSRTRVSTRHLVRGPKIGRIFQQHSNVFEKDLEVIPLDELFYLQPVAFGTCSMTRTNRLTN